MKTRMLFLLLLVPLMGCEALKKITDGPSSTSGPGPLPNDFTSSGVTVVDYQGFAPFRTANSTITVKVKRVGEDWHICNKYEVSITTTGTGGVFFSKICYPTFDDNGKLIYLVLTGKPVAPIGTLYEIRSVLNS